MWHNCSKTTKTCYTLGDDDDLQIYFLHPQSTPTQEHIACGVELQSLYIYYKIQVSTFIVVGKRTHRCYIQGIYHIASVHGCTIFCGADFLVYLSPHPQWYNTVIIIQFGKYNPARNGIVTIQFTTLFSVAKVEVFFVSGFRIVA